MYLSDHDLEDAVQRGSLIVKPPPATYDTTSIDLHLDQISTAMVWDIDSFENDQKIAGIEFPILGMKFQHKAFAKKYHRPIPPDRSQRVFRDGDTIVLKPQGFFLWQTAEVVGTPEENPEYICFIDGKSTKARMGLLVHMTAPTIHAGWWGNVTLEICNLGPFNLALRPGDEVAQIVVARLTSPPTKRKQAKGISVGQSGVGGLGV
jgi:dCTP deaminase